VDASPEFRLQALRAGISRLDALLLTHAHADHLHGLDDIRPLTHHSPLPIYGNEVTLAEVRERFVYAFRTGQIGGGKPRMELRPVESGRFMVGDIEVTALPLLHGTLSILGWRFGSFAWLPDCSAIPPATMGLLAGLESAAIDGLRTRSHPTHFSVGEAIEAARSMALRETWLIHMTHDHSHREFESICARLGSDVGSRPAWDGLEIEINRPDKP
jgi:phosphoribosyl 1,2-cyclic phosphate phosphodiesterase